MDNIAMILFGCVLCTMMGLNFMELHRIRKNLERHDKTKESMKA